MKAGVSEEEIAARLSLPPDKVKESIQNYNSYRASLSHDIIDTAVNAEVLTAMDGVGEDLREARNALRFTGAYDQEGSPIYDRDIPLMLESISAMGSLMEKTRPKGGGVQINTAIQNNGQGGNGNGNGQGRSFEAMLREAKAQRAITDGGGGGGTAVAEAEVGTDSDIQDAEFDESDDDADADDNGYDDADDAGIDEEMDNGE